MKRFTTKLLSILVCMLIFCAAASAQSTPYTVRLEAAEAIYAGPGAEYGYSRTVGEDGVYTIVEEVYDAFGNLWGRLKSGVGWVMLAEGAPVVIHETPYTTALSASEDICGGPGYSYGYLRDVGKDGVYTIVEEAVGDDGFLWGRLKSGLGWVRLSDAAMEVPMEAPMGAPMGAEEYTESLGAWVSVYSAPPEEGGVCVGIIGEDGVYTIIGEYADSLGNLWGRLKSGAGWVNLSYVRMAGRPPIAAYPAEALDLTGASLCEYNAAESGNVMRIAFRANERLSNVKFAEIRYENDSYVLEEDHYWIPWIVEEGYFVAGVVFYGDMTTYGISFEDEAGEQRYYAVMLSGMDGSLVMNEYVP